VIALAPVIPDAAQQSFIVAALIRDLGKGIIECKIPCLRRTVKTPRRARNDG
jgi:hypothetical protein